MRTTSQVKDTNFPFADDRVPFVLVHNGVEFPDDAARGFGHASTWEKKLGLLEVAKEAARDGEYGAQEGGCSLLAMWPGATRTDVFLIDDLDEASAAFG